MNSFGPKDDAVQCGCIHCLFVRINVAELPEQWLHEEISSTLDCHVQHTFAMIAIFISKHIVVRNISSANFINNYLACLAYFSLSSILSKSNGFFRFRIMWQHFMANVHPPDGFIDWNCAKNPRTLIQSIHPLEYELNAFFLPVQRNSVFYAKMNLFSGWKLKA